MSTVTLDPAHVADLVRQKLSPFAERAGVDLKLVKPDSDLLALGIVDSFDVVTILSQLEDDLGLAPEFPECEDEAFVLSPAWIGEGFMRGKKALK